MVRPRRRDPRFLEPLGGTDREGNRARRPSRFPLATNPARFTPQAHDLERAADYVFTGNHWGKDRDIQAGARPPQGRALRHLRKGLGRGPGDGRVRRAARPPTTDLPAIYSSAKLVLDDTSGPTLPYGAVNSRVFDALASRHAGDHQLRVRACESCSARTSRSGARRESCASRLDALLGDDETAGGPGPRATAAEVLRQHTYAHRARRLVEILDRATRRGSPSA